MTDAELKFQYFGHLMQSADSFEKNMMVGKIGARRRRGRQRMRWWMVSPTQWTWVRASSGSWWWTGRPGMLQSMGSQRVGHDWTDWLEACSQACSGQELTLSPAGAFNILYKPPGQGLGQRLGSHKALAASTFTVRSRHPAPLGWKLITTWKGKGQHYFHSACICYITGFLFQHV